MKKREEKREPQRSDQSDSSQAGFTLDFGGPLGPSSCQCLSAGNRIGSSGFDNTPKAPHDWSKMKPPGYPSLF